MIRETLNEHKQGILIGGLGWIINIPYWFYEVVIKGIPVIGHSKELLLEHILITGTIPIFMLVGYLYDRKVTLEKKLINHSSALEGEVKRRTRDLEKKIRELQGLYEISDILREESNPQNISRDITEKLAELFEVGKCCIIIYDTEKMEFHPLKPAYGMTDKQLEALHFSLDDLADVFEKWPQKEPLVSNEPLMDDRLAGDTARRFGANSILLAKLLVGGEFLGMLMLAEKKEGFTRSDAHFAEILASRIGAALQTTRLIAELRQSEEYHRGLMENAADAIFVLSTRGKCLDANPKAASLTGYNKEELLEMDIEQLFHHPQRKLLRQKFAQTLKKGRCFCDEFLILTKIGQVIPVEISASTLEMGGRRIVMAIIRDVTERKKMEDAIRESNQRLRTAYQELKKLDKAKDELIARVSHELRTPLTVVTGILEVMKEDETREDRIKLYQVALNALAKQDIIIEDLIGISTARRGRLRIFPMRIDLHSILESAISEIASAAEERHINIRKEFQNNVPEVEADPKRLRHAVRNLLDNAVKFNREGGEINVHLTMRKDINAVEVCVGDTGIGIPEKHLDKVFDHFYQVDGSLTRRYGGTGLGLTVAKEIIEAHNGTIRVESREGEGSKFCFTLPVGNHPVNPRTRV
jgi:PAS domain S-box-containing protein